MVEFFGMFGTVSSSIEAGRSFSLLHPSIFVFSESSNQHATLYRIIMPLGVIGGFHRNTATISYWY